MTDPTRTHIELIIDSSGSMAAQQSATEEGIAAFLAEQRKLPGKATVTLTTFNYGSTVQYANLPIGQIPPFRLRPNGGTALLDAIGDRIGACGEYLASLPEDKRPGLVLVEIVTDGYENSSHYFTSAEVKAAIERQTTQYSWVFGYLGANQDAILVGEGLGINRGQTMTYDAHNTQVAFAAASGQTTALRSAVASGETVAVAAAAGGYSDSEREQAVAGSPSSTSKSGA